MKRIWKTVDGSINIYTGKDQKAKKAVIAIAKRHGYNAVDMVDQVAIESTKKSEIIKKLNRELAESGIAVYAKIAEASSLKDYLSDYAKMSDSPELKEYLGKMEEQSEEMRDKAQHSLKDCVEDAERKMESSSKSYTDEEISFLKSLSYLDSHEIKDLLAGHTDLEVLLDPEDLEKFNGLGKTEAREVQQKDIDFIRSKMGSGLLKHAVFNPEFIEKQKAATLERALLSAAQTSGWPISDFAMWAASEDAAILADELYAELAGTELKNMPAQGKFTNVFIQSMNDYFKSMNKNEYLEEHEMWEEKLGTRSKPKSAPLIKKIKHLFAA